VGFHSLYSSGSLPSHQTHDERYQKQQYEYEKQNLGDFNGTGCDAGKAE
jgi:hypothetical protein